MKLKKNNIKIFFKKSQKQKVINIKKGRTENYN